MLPPFVLRVAYFALVVLLQASSSAARMRSPLHRRQDSPPPVTINTTILDHTGADITSSFKTMLFHQTQNVSAASNLTDKRSLSTRWLPYDKDYSEPSSLFRTIISCSGDGGPNWRFERSECDHSRSVQAYTYWCRPYVRARPATPGDWGRFGPAEPQQGSCEKHETCINGPERSNQGEVQVAWCVDVDAFVELASDATGGSGSQAGRVGDKNFEVQEEHQGGSKGSTTGVDDLQLGGMTVSAVASKADGTSPLSMQMLDVEAGVLGGDGTNLVGADGTAVQSQRCENCVDLETEQFRKGTEALRTEATLLTTGTVAGVLWLAVLSG